MLTARRKLFGLRGLECPDKICPPVKMLPLMYRKKTTFTSGESLLAYRCYYLQQVLPDSEAMAHTYSHSWRRIRKGAESLEIKCGQKVCILHFCIKVGCCLSHRDTGLPFQPNPERHQPLHPESNCPAVNYFMGKMTPVQITGLVSKQHLLSASNWQFLHFGHGTQLLQVFSLGRFIGSDKFPL